MSEMLQFMVFGVLVFTCYGFLLNNGIVPTRNNITDSNYVYVMDQISQDRQNIQLLEHFFLKLQQQLDNLKNTHISVPNQDISQVRDQCVMLNQTLVEWQQRFEFIKNKLLQVETHNLLLHQDIAQLQNDNTRLQNDVYKCSNDTIKVKEDLYAFTHSTTAGQIKNTTEMQENIETLNQKMDKTIAKLDLLSSSSEARNEDFIALLNKTKNNEKVIGDLVTDSKQSKSELLSFQNSTEQKMASIYKTVFLTSAAEGGEIKTGQVIRFPTIKTHYGIKDLDKFTQSGIFTCELSGVYFFSVLLASLSTEVSCYMNKNNNAVIYILVTGGNHGGHYHSGTGVMVVSLNTGDTLSVITYSNMNIAGHPWSSMTIIKIR